MSFERDLRRLEHESELARSASWRRVRNREPGTAEAVFVTARPARTWRVLRVGWRGLSRALGWGRQAGPRTDCGPMTTRPAARSAGA